MTTADAPLVSVTDADLAELNRRLDDRSPRDIIAWAHGLFGARLALLSSMQKPESVISHHMAALDVAGDIDVLFVDTGANFRETYETLERLREAYKLRIVALHPARTMAEQTREEGVLYLTNEGQIRCCDLRKKQPLRQAARGRYDALMGGLLRGSGGRRANVPVVSIDADLNLVRVCPLAALDMAAVDRYARENNVVYHPLHDQGYPTIGCDRCTTPTLPGESERAGRWRHLENAPQYCNINPTDRQRAADAPPPSIQWPAPLAEKLLAVEGP